MPIGKTHEQFPYLFWEPIPLDYRERCNGENRLHMFLAVIYPKFKTEGRSSWLDFVQNKHTCIKQNILCL